MLFLASDIGWCQGKTMPYKEDLKLKNLGKESQGLDIIIKTVRKTIVICLDQETFLNASWKDCM